MAPLAGRASGRGQLVRGAPTAFAPDSSSTRHDGVLTLVHWSTEVRRATIEQRPAACVGVAGAF
ncbi:MAG TPA: hypothetical protein VFN87_03870 [Solirubrobacteraceae bacterium]|nr:hypothetical protein [Solirubrobacteraceae bacterium]